MNTITPYVPIREPLDFFLKILNPRIAGFLLGSRIQESMDFRLDSLSTNPESKNTNLKNTKERIQRIYESMGSRLDSNAKDFLNV